MATITSLPVAATIDATADTFPIVTNSLNTTQQINRNTFLNLASQPVGLTDTQVLTNKTLTSPTINGATLSGTLAGTYTIGGTPTFPSSVTQNTVSQTLTNKTLTSPTINSPTITNATISADTLTGYTTSNSGTIYGVGVTTGQISGSNTVLPAALATGIPSNKFANPYKFSVYLNTATNTLSSSWLAIPYDFKLFDTGTNVDLVTNKGRFTAPVSGFYWFSAQSGFTGSNNARSIVSLFKNGTSNEIIRGTDVTQTGYGIGTVSSIVQLSAGDYINVGVYSTGVYALGYGSLGVQNWFSGFLISAT